ncbi:uncharacterized protein LOC125029737 [Penaeus chinensis]|uniref:uncharacterized protein LOC125029737 n=1 Tax=Penaeus chinensis TaxID=139456 RepID=UPI001FB75538|nr:uncharacterized protein LOC125029737 [Penaeus chinensis]
MADILHKFNQISLRENSSQHDINESLKAGVLAEARAPAGGLRYFHCFTCGKENIFDIASHIQQLSHRNSLAWVVIKLDHPSPALLHLLPEDVRLAKLDGHVEAVSRTVFSFQCKVCLGKRPFSGLMPLLQHLSGKEHKKALDRTTRSPPVAQPAPILSTHAFSPPSSTYPFGQQAVPVTEPPPSVLAPPSLVCDNLDIVKAEVEKSLRCGVVTVVEKTETHTSYFCKSCRAPLTGDEPLRQHVMGKTHKKKTKESQVDSVALDPEPMRPLMPLSPPVMNPIWQFPWNVKPAPYSRLPDAGVYKNLSVPRGIVYIFNYYFSDTQSVRSGATVDTYNLKELFVRMGYHVKVHEELSKEATEERLCAIQSDAVLDHYDSFIMIFLSHGKDDTVFYTEDRAMMSLDDVRYFFVDGKCPRLKNKPKLFLANFCRGTVEERRKYETDYSGSGQTAEAPQDMVTIYASIKKFMAVRDSEKGTVFVQALCQVLAEYAHELELQELYNKLCSAMREREGTTPEYQNYFFKKFFFNPVLIEGPPKP